MFGNKSNKRLTKVDVKQAKNLQTQSIPTRISYTVVEVTMPHLCLDHYTAKMLLVTYDEWTN